MKNSKKTVSTYFTISSLVLLFWATLLVPSFVVVSFSLWHETGQRALISIPTGRWRVLQNNPTCIINKNDCQVANVNSDLWKKTLERGSKVYIDWIQKDRPTEYWLGLEISGLELKRAFDLKANQIILGKFLSGYEVWVDGRLVETRKAYESDSPIKINLTEERLLKEQGLKIALRILNNLHGFQVDYPSSIGSDGFYTFSDSEKVLRSDYFYGQTQHWILFALYFALASLFAMIWRAERHKKIYWVSSIYSMISATLHLLYLDSVDRLLDIGTWYRIYTPLVVGEAAAIFLLGFTLKRSLNKHALLFSVWTCAIVFMSAIFLRNLEWARIILSHIQTYLLPGAWLCTAYMAWSERKNLKMTNKDRDYLLILMGFWGFLCGVAQAVTSYYTPFPNIDLHWERALNFLPLMHLLTLFGRDFRIHAAILAKSPVSTYHKQNILPSEINGYLLAIDLKRAEYFYREGARRNQGGTWVNIIISHLWSLAAEMKGIVLQSEGDSISIFFPKELGYTSFEFKQLLCHMNETLLKLSSQLSEELMEFSFNKIIHFRGALVEGSVKPIWRSINNTNHPSWIEAGSENVFVRVSRYFEIEKECEESKNKSTLMISSFLKDKFMEEKTISENSPSWIYKDREFVGKHGYTYNVSLISLEDLKLENLAAKAS